MRINNYRVWAAQIDYKIWPMRWSLIGLLLKLKETLFIFALMEN